MEAKKLRIGSTIGLTAPCYMAEPGKYDGTIRNLEAMGFRVKMSRNLYKNTYGYAASEAERAGDFMDMVLDDEVEMILFGGGYVGNEILPLLDYKAIREHPKVIVSYSGGTPILLAIYSRTGLVTYYGQRPSTFMEITEYNFGQFKKHFMENGTGHMEKNSTWTALTPGRGEGRLVGGYLEEFSRGINGTYLKVDPTEHYLLFLEEHKKFYPPGGVSTFLSHIEQSGFMKKVGGLLFGHYSESQNVQVWDRLTRLGEKYSIPVVICDDFGHGANCGILPIGYRAVLDADTVELNFLGE